MKKVGILTIGQSPREDVTPSIKNILGPQVEVIERGALDSIGDHQLQEITPTAHEKTYISKLRNGKSTKISKEKLLPLLQKELTALEKEVDVVLMLCTGDFPTLQCHIPIFYPDKILTHVVQAVLVEGNILGLIIPLEEQRKSLAEKWKDVGFDLTISVASPYDESDIEAAALELKNQGANVIVLDCMGYHEEHKKRSQKASYLPVILSRTLAASIIKEYIA